MNDAFHKPSANELDGEDLTRDYAFLFEKNRQPRPSAGMSSAPVSAVGASIPPRGTFARPSPDVRPFDDTVVYRPAAAPAEPVPTPRLAPQEIDWAAYDFDFADEFGTPQPAETPAPAAAPAPQETAFSVDAMRRLHDGQRASAAAAGRVRPAQTPPAAERRSRPAAAPVYEPAYGPVDRTPEPPAPASGPPRKKHRVLKAVLLTLLALLLIGAIVLAVLWFTAKQPMTDLPVGARRDGCSTILLAGTDEEGTRTDTIILLYVDRPNKTMRLLSIPRDTKVNRDNPVPKINGAYGANGLGEKGMNALMEYVQDVIGYRPDGYVLIDLNCFEQLVDQMGGVDFNVPQDMYYEDPAQDLYIDLKAGQQHLNGKQAMWLVRFRSGYALQDMTRMETQRSFLTEALHQWCSIGRIFRVPGAFRLLRENTQTDLSESELLWLARSFVMCRGNGLQSRTLPGTNSDQGNGWYFYEDVDAAAAMINAEFNPYQIEITPDMLHPYGR